MAIRDLTYHFSGHKMQGSWLYDNLLVRDFVTVEQNVQLDDNDSVWSEHKRISQSVGKN